MTLTRFVTKSAFRNKRRSVLTVLSISFSLILLTLMMTIWRGFYIDKGSAESAQRLVMRLLGERIAEAAAGPGGQDYKTRLQELAARQLGV